MSVKSRLEKLEQRLRPEQRIVLVDGCDPPCWTVSGDPAEHQGEPDIRESDLVVRWLGNVCLRAL